MTRTAVGVDIGGTRLRVAIIAQDGTILGRAKAASSPDPETVVSRIEALIAGLDITSATAIGLGVPGRVDFAARRMVSGGFVDLSGLPVAERLEQRFGLPVVMDNDCTMALIAEAAIGAARGLRNVLMLTIGTGIGGAILENGRIPRGRGAAGQLGHIAIDPNGRACVCGKRGCVETVSSGTALGRHVAEAGLSAGATAADLLARRDAGDAKAAAVLMAWATPLRMAIESLVTVADPDLVVLGGGLGVDALRALSAVPAARSWFGCPIVAASLGDDAGVIGAGLAALRMAKPGGKRLVLVNGVPASGKSRVAHALALATGWPVLSLDTVKNPFLEEIDGVDRPFNRKLGRASLKAMIAIADDAPPGSTLILDAWFGFQPREWIDRLISALDLDATAEIWCVAPPETIGVRYANRTRDRPAGHPGKDYVPELIELAARAEPLRLGPILEVDTTTAADAGAIVAWLNRTFA